MMQGLTKVHGPAFLLGRPKAQARRLVAARASEGKWLPGSEAPEHLDGSLPGDYGFDPLELGKSPKNLAR